MIRRGKQLIKNHMTLDYEFAGIRIQNGYMTPVDWILKVNLIASEKKGRTKQDIENSAGIAYEKLYFWLETNMPSVVAADVTNEEDLYLSNLCANITMYCPGNPGDDMIVRLLHSKLSTLSEKDLIVSEMTLKGSDTSLHYNFDCEDGNYDLPSSTAEYCTNGIKRDSVPWWMRDDGFCSEFIRYEDEETEEKKLFSEIIDPMSEFYKIILEAAEYRNLIKEPAKVLQIEKWKPKKVE